MKVTDFNRLKKLMPMTRSDSDAEALMAIRQANKLLEASNVSWEQVFSRLVTVDVEDSSETYRDGPRDHDASSRKAYIEDLLHHVTAEATGSFLDFVADLSEQFERTGYLSKLQVEALEKSAARSARPAFRR